jgi:hypothetical protein
MRKLSAWTALAPRELTSSEPNAYPIVIIRAHDVKTEAACA